MCSASDGKGRSDLANVRILPGLSRLASEFAANRAFPFRTSGDVYRFCIAYGLDHLSHVEPPKFNIGVFLREEMQVLADQQYLRDQHLYMDGLKELVRYHVAQETPANRLYAKARVEEAIARAAGITDKAWRKSQLKALRKEFQQVLKMKVDLPDVVSANPEEYDEEEGEEGED